MSVVLITNETPPKTYDYQGPIPRVGDAVELRVPPNGTYVLFVVTSVRYVTDGPLDSDSVTVTGVEVRGRVI